MPFLSSFSIILRMCCFLFSWLQDGCHSTKHHTLKRQHPTMSQNLSFPPSFSLPSTHSRQGTLSHKPPHRLSHNSNWPELSHMPILDWSLAKTVRINRIALELLYCWINKHLWPWGKEPFSETSRVKCPKQTWVLLTRKEGDGCWMGNLEPGLKLKPSPLSSYFPTW